MNENKLRYSHYSWLCGFTGVWADDSDEEAPARSSKGFKGSSRAPKNYTAPVSFVAGGVQQAGKPKEEKKDEDDDDDDDTGRAKRGDADYVPNSSR